eukprot:6209241-Pleurochrysis_carterae.AAC.2
MPFATSSPALSRGRVSMPSRLSVRAFVSAHLRALERVCASVFTFASCLRALRSCLRARIFVPMCACARARVSASARVSARALLFTCASACTQCAREDAQADGQVERTAIG